MPLESRGWRRFVPFVVLALMVAAVVVGTRNRADPAQSAWDAVLEWVYLAALFSASLTNVAICVLVTLVAFRARRAGILAWAALGLCAVNVLLEFVCTFVLEDPREARTIWHDVAQTSSLGVQYFTLIVLVLMPRLRGTARGWQVAAVACIVGVYVLYAPTSLGFNTQWVPVTVVVPVRYFVDIGALVSVAMVAWYTLQREPSAAPAVESVSLTCPQCKSVQSVTINGGACGNCQLPIHVTVGEAIA
jgi:hypothetical protein